jgi:endo-1,3(4)-beta-glucanase
MERHLVPQGFSLPENRIHMLPLLPSSAYTRTKPFVRQEWDQYFAPGAVKPAKKVEGGWKGILYANLALIDAKRAWEFFSQGSFDYSWIDGGATRTWYLAFAAGEYSDSEG